MGCGGLHGHRSRGPPLDCALPMDGAAGQEVRTHFLHESASIDIGGTTSQAVQSLAPRAHYFPKPIFLDAVHQSLQDEGGNTPLHRAARAANLALVKKLVPFATPQSLQIQNCSGFTPLHYIVKHQRKGWYNTLRMVLEKGGYTTAGNSDNDTPLHLAARARNINAVEALVDYELQTRGCVRHLPLNKGKKTPLDIAVEATHDPTMADKILTLVKKSDFLNQLFKIVLNTYGTSNTAKDDGGDGKECPQAMLLWLLSLQHSSAILSMDYLNMVWQLVDEPQMQELFLQWMKGGAWLYYALRWLVTRPDFNVNYVYADGQTILHIALLEEYEDVVKLVLKRRELIEADTEDEKGITPLQHAVEKGFREIEILLMRRSEVKESMERLYRDRQVYVDAANAILVGAALIASVTFAGWLQPPLGYGNGKIWPYVAIDGHPGISSFWVSNSLSFLFAMATLVAGAGGVLPKPNLYIGTAVHVLQTSLSIAACLLLLSVMFGITAFCSAGFAVLPPSFRWNSDMIITVVPGAAVNIIMMGWFLKKLYHLRPGHIKRRREEILKNRLKAKARRIAPICPQKCLRTWG